MNLYVKLGSLQHRLTYSGLPITTGLSNLFYLLTIEYRVLHSLNVYLQLCVNLNR